MPCTCARFRRCLERAEVDWYFAGPLMLTRAEPCRFVLKHSLVTLFIALAAAGCGGDGGASPDNDAGSGGSGAVDGSGGAAQSSGGQSSSSGGASGGGGSGATTGGSDGSGGDSSSGGDTGLGGDAGTGGDVGTGGDAGTGGDSGSGGNIGSGGDSGSGGTGSGGEPGTGGGSTGGTSSGGTGGTSSGGAGTGGAGTGGAGTGGTAGGASCETDNGGCGDPTFTACNDDGGPVTCTDIDECLVNNGGCGDAQFNDCENHAGSPTTCSDIDECLLGEDDCADAANCTNEAPGFTCECKPGFSGDGTTCVSEGCAGENPCAPGTCNTESSGYSCTCPCGFAAQGGTCVDLYPHIWFVDVTAPAPGNGQCWSTAFKDLNDALEVAGPGDAVWVADGVYYPGTLRTDTFQIPAGVSVYGGFKGTETTFAQRNVKSNLAYLDGDIDKNRGTATYPASINGDSYHIVTVDAGAGSARLDGVTVRSGYANDAVGYGAGAYLKSGTLTLSETVFTLQEVVHMQYRGASAFASGGTLIVDKSDFKSSYGAIRIDNAHLTVTNTKFTPYTLGRALSMNGGTATMTDCTATFGPIETKNANLTLIRNTLTGSQFVGALNIQGGTVKLVDSTVTNNWSETNGGAIAASAGAIVEISGTHFQNNLVQEMGKSEGAALYGDSISAHISDCTFLENRAGFDGINSVGGSGGGIFLRNSSSEILENLFDTNYARGAGGAVVITGGSSVIDGNVFTENSAYGNGGALRTDAADVVVSNNVFELSAARLHGGAIDVGKGSVEIVGCTFTDNAAQQGGGAIHGGYSNWDVTDTTLVVVAHSTFDSHTAAFGGLLFAQRHFHFIQVGSRGTSALSSGTSTRKGKGGIVYARFPVTLESSTFADFSAAVSGTMVELEDDVEPGAGAIATRESVLWTDAAGAWVSGPGTATFESSCVTAANATASNTSLAASPFVTLGTAEALRYELQLASDSVCKDQLTLSELPVDVWDLDGDLDVSEAWPFDLAGLPRSVGGAADLGAFEEQGVEPGG